MKDIARKISRVACITPLCTLFLLMAPGHLVAQKNASFLDRREFIAADATGPAAIGDLNGDGIADLVVPAENPNLMQVSVLLGKADGTFQSPKFVNVGGVGPRSAVIADFNGDGKNDVAVVTLTGVSVLLGDGHGNFGAPQTLTAGTNPFAIVAGDFNGDKKIDLAVVNAGSNDVSIFLGNGHGGFALTESLPVGVAPIAIATGDFNHDGHLDLVVSNSNLPGGNEGTNGNTVAILLGTGSGGFKPATFVTVATDPRGVAVGDFNNDNNLDVVVTSFDLNKVSVLLGNGDGTFKTPITMGVGVNPDAVSVDDFNSDGHPDLVVSSPTQSTAYVLLGKGKGKFQPPVPIEVGRQPLGVATGDFNRDGKRDFLTSNFDANTVSVVLGNGDGTFQVAPRFAVAQNPAQVIVADFNNDGIPDIATANFNTNTGTTVSVLLGQKRGGFAPALSSTVGKGPVSLAASDFNKDGRIDLIVACAGDGSLFGKDLGQVDLLIGNGDGTFQPAVTLVKGSIFNGEIPGAIVAGDFNSDGNPDFIVTFFSGAKTFSLFEGDGKGNFNRRELTTLGGSTVTQLSVADFNRDGKPDLAIQGVNETQIALGNGDGTFQNQRLVVFIGSQGLSMASAVGDFNNDGFPDIAVEENGVVEMFIGDGTGNFTSVGKFQDNHRSAFSVTTVMAVGDFNGDGFLDLAAPDSFADNVDILLGRGDGTLNAPGQISGGVSANGIVAADFNGDHRTDLGVAGGGGVTVLLNNTH